MTSTGNKSKAGERLPMVQWYDPLQLLKTAQQVIISTIFGAYSDHRLVEVVGLASDDLFDYTKEGTNPRNDIWIDYVADTGDGWNSTYAVAHALAQPTLRLALQGEKTQDVTTYSGRVLIFGGDEVYPTASRQEYKRRLVAPYKAARRICPNPKPDVFAIPGNHDWYDGLVSFTRLFLSKGRFATWACPQKRSYFALRLPHGWWLFGTDVQLGSDIDGPQVAYFQKAANEMKQDDRIILCNAEPYWIYEKAYSKYDDEIYNESNLKFLETEIFNRKIDVFIAGDLHHYRRHELNENGAKRQKITAGGGGAFLHPTHGPDVSELPGGYKLAKCFPTRGISAALCWRNLAFPFFNPHFGWLTAALYLLTAWMVFAPVESLGINHYNRAVTTTLEAVFGDATVTLWVVLVISAIMLFTDTHSRTQRFLGGGLHALAHLVAVFCAGWAAGYFTMKVLGIGGWPSFLVAGILIFAAGWIVGPFLLGVYLLISLNLFHRHGNEAFSCLSCPDWKNFLPMHIGTDGSLTIYPIGIRKVPRRWTLTPPDAISDLKPDDDRATAPELIEPPIQI